MTGTLLRSLRNYKMRTAIDRTLLRSYGFDSPDSLDFTLYFAGAVTGVCDVSGWLDAGGFLVFGKDHPLEFIECDALYEIHSTAAETAACHPRADDACDRGSDIDKDV